MEAIENCKGHRNVGDNYPSPLTVEHQMVRSEAGMTFDQSVDEPHRNVGHEKESHDLPARSANKNDKMFAIILKLISLLVPDLLSSFASSPAWVENKQSLSWYLNQT